MNAICDFELNDLPSIVTASSDGASVYNTGPKAWQAKIRKIPVAVA